MSPILAATAFGNVSPAAATDFPESAVVPTLRKDPTQLTDVLLCNVIGMTFGTLPISRCYKSECGQEGETLGI